VLLNKEADRTF